MKVQKRKTGKVAHIQDTDDFAAEEAVVDPRDLPREYPWEFKGPKPIGEQVKMLAELFDLSTDATDRYLESVLPTYDLPDDAEGWFAIPSIDALAMRHFPEVVDPAQRYCCALKTVLSKIGATRKFLSLEEERFTPDRLRMSARTANALDVIREGQKGDILIVGAQLGLRHRGRSMRRARAVFAANEFGLGSIAVGSILLTHPERIVCRFELRMDCAGDEHAFRTPGDFFSAPLYSSLGLLHIGTCETNRCGKEVAAVSAFLPTRRKT